MSAGRPAKFGRPDGVIFDCDGLLVDTEPSWEHAEVQMFADRGFDYGPAERARFIGISVYAASELMATTFGETGKEEALLAELLERVSGLLRQEARPMPGALAVVSRMTAAGMPLAVASNSPLDIVRVSLAGAGLEAAFAAIVSIEDVVVPKPGPEPYLEAARRLRAEPGRTVAFEDSHTGLASAKAAGLLTIGVPSISGEFPADWVLGSLTEPALEEWIETW